MHTTQTEHPEGYTIVDPDLNWHSYIYIMKKIIKKIRVYLILRQIKKNENKDRYLYWG
jgi:hypothetical protein